MTKRRGHGEGTIYQKGNSWMGQVTLPDGKRKSKSFKTRGEARDWVRTQREAIAKGVWTSQEKITVGEYLDRWLSDVVMHTLRPKTIESYEGIVRLYLKPEIGSIKLTALRPDHLQKMYTEMLDRGLSRRTVHYAHAIIHRALHQAFKWGLVPRNIADLADPPRPKPKEFQALNVEQLKKFLEVNQDDLYYPLYVLAIATGLRKGELLGLRWEDVDFFSGTIHIRQTVGEIKGKGIVIGEPKSDRSRRAIAVPGYALDVLWEYKEKEGRTEGLVFVSTRKTPLSPRNIVRYFKEALRRAGLPDTIRFHDLRHTTATLMLREGVHPKVVQATLGHSQIGLTMDTYSHVMPDIQRDAADKMEKIFSVAKPLHK